MLHVIHDGFFLRACASGRRSVSISQITGEWPGSSRIISRKVRVAQGLAFVVDREYVRPALHAASTEVPRVFSLKGVGQCGSWTKEDQHALG